VTICQRLLYEQVVLSAMFIMRGGLESVAERASLFSVEVPSQRPLARER
jgi:hypothetical protein